MLEQDDRTLEAHLALDPDSLMSAASGQTGLEDFGDERFVEPLRRYCTALVDEAHLHPAAVVMMQMQIVSSLATRLHLQDDLKRHPEILEEVITPPIVIAGLPRTGTTKLHRMMAQDPGLQSLTFWRVATPAPLPGWKPGDPHDERIAIGEAMAAAFREMLPEVVAAHYTDAHEADEEIRLMQLSFESHTNAIMAPNVDSYWSWVMNRSQSTTYEYLHLLLRYLQWQDEGGRGRPWVLKAPLHTGNFDALADVFPGATVVHTYRDPAQLIASVTRMVEVLWRALTDEVDLVRLGQTMLTSWSTLMLRGMAQRDEIGDGLSFLDVPYEAVRQDSSAVIRRIYELRGDTLTAAAADGMERWAAENPQNRHGVFEYSLERYGLTQSTVEEVFAPYLDRYIRSVKA